MSGWLLIDNYRRDDRDNCVVATAEKEDDKKAFTVVDKAVQ